MEFEHRSHLEELERQGWVRQFVANEPRLSEAVALYEELGFEVHLEPLPKGLECGTCAGTDGPGEQGACRVCFEGFEEPYRILYTRPRKNPPAS